MAMSEQTTSGITSASVDDQGIERYACAALLHKYERSESGKDA